MNAATSDVWLLAAKRSPVAKRDGALAHLQAWELASPLITTLLAQCQLPATAVDHVLMGNALYGGGNPARLAALHAGLPDTVPALTIDSQCCGGMDAIALGAQLIRSGAAQVVIAGGLESWSRAPKRISQPLEGSPAAYDRPPFSPWPARDPDMLSAAAALAAARQISRHSQDSYAEASHQKSSDADHTAAIQTISGVSKDEYTRQLNPRLCARMQALAGQPPFELTAATIAAQADAAALVIMVSNKYIQQTPNNSPAIRLVAAASGGGDPEQPAIAPIAVAKKLLQHAKLSAADLYSVHLMEAFAVQAMAFIDDLAIDPQICNPQGGALARGHPIGASGAIEVVGGFHALQSAATSSRALCAIAAAGGLGSALLLEKP